MLRAQISIDTGGRRTIDITAETVDFCAGSGDGLLNVFVPHATAGIALIETGAGSDEDLAELVERVFPRDDRYVHKHGARGHGADHVLPALVSPSLVIPVIDGRPQLGTWQSIVLVDFNEDNRMRQVVLSLLEDRG